MRERRLKILGAADIYGLTGEEFAAGKTNVETVAALLAAGVEVIQYREKEKDGRVMYEECLAIREMTRTAGALLIVNDHVDLALAVDADGVHVGQDDLPVAVVRRLIGPERLLGLSTHSPEQALAAVAGGVVDHIGVGPIYATQTKKNVCAAVGLEYLRFVAAEIPLPFVAIGGIKTHNVAEVIQAGASLVAMITELVGTTDVTGKVADVRAIIRRARA